MYRFFFYNFEYYVLSEFRTNNYYDQIFWDLYICYPVFSITTTRCTEHFP